MEGCTLYIRQFDALPDEAVFIRKEVFMKEQGFKNEFDATDKRSLFLVGYQNGKPAATCRIFYNPENDIYIFGRIAVLKCYRGNGLGSELLKNAEDYIKSKNAKKAGIFAQVRAVPFYETLGFTCKGDEYLDENCPHIYMEKLL